MGKNKITEFHFLCKAIPHEISKTPVPKLSFKFTNVIFQLHIPVPNKLYLIVA